MRKKFVILKILFICVMTMMSCNYVFATSDAKIEIESSGSAKRGSEITATVYLTGTSEGISGLQGKITYDSNVLEYKSISIVDKENWLVSGFNKDTGIFLAELINIADDSKCIKNKKTAVLKFTFTVKEDTTISSTDIKISNAAISPSSAKLLSTDTVDSIKIENADKDTGNEEEKEKEKTIEETEKDKKQETEEKESDIPDTGLGHVAIIGTFLVLLAIYFYCSYKKYKNLN